MLTARDVTNQRFAPTQFRHGYDERQVDDFLDQVVRPCATTSRAVGSVSRYPHPQHGPTSRQRRAVAGTTSEVDDFLDQVVETLRYYQRGGRPVAQAPASSARTKSEGLGQRATLWLRGDPPS